MAQKNVLSLKLMSARRPRQNTTMRLLQEKLLSSHIHQLVGMFSNCLKSCLVTSLRIVKHTWELIVHRNSKLRTKVTVLDCLWLLSPPTWVIQVILWRKELASRDNLYPLSSSHNSTKLRICLRSSTTVATLSQVKMSQTSFGTCR
jgi:hypothetical protein